jgi:hypothetical protein
LSLCGNRAGRETWGGQHSRDRIDVDRVAITEGVVGIVGVSVPAAITDSDAQPNAAPSGAAVAAAQAGAIAAPAAADLAEGVAAATVDLTGRARPTRSDVEENGCEYPRQNWKTATNHAYLPSGIVEATRLVDGRRAFPVHAAGDARREPLASIPDPGIRS